MNPDGHPDGPVRPARHRRSDDAAGATTAFDPREQPGGPEPDEAEPYGPYGPYGPHGSQPHDPESHSPAPYAPESYAPASYEPEPDAPDAPGSYERELYGSGSYETQSYENQSYGTGSYGTGSYGTESYEPLPDEPLRGWAAALLVFLTSGAVLVLEIVSLRLVAPYLGVTLETSTAVIGVALAAIAAGTWLGGRAADAVSPSRSIGPLVLVSGALVTVVLPVVRRTGELVRGGHVSGALLLATVAILLPAALLSAVAPMVVKLQLDKLEETGTVVGRLSGAGTLGAIVATIVTGFVLVATAPTSFVLLGLGGLLVLVGAILTVRRRGVKSAAIPLVVALIGAETTVLVPWPCQTETGYHCARVVTDPFRPTGRTLELDTLRHSYVDLAEPTHLEFSYIRGIAAAVDVFRPTGTPVRALHLGGGGFTLPRYLSATRPGSDSLVLEIDAGVVNIDIAKLGLRLGNGITARVQDARIGLAAEPADSRDLVVGDAFGGIAVPWHLTTRETVADVRRVLTGDGLYAVNVIDYPPLRFARAEVATIAAEFPHVAVVTRPGAMAGQDGGNFVVLASDQPLPIDALGPWVAQRVGEFAVFAGQESVAAFTNGAQVLTDDHAPVDQLLTPYPPW